ncbi:TPA: hypothetical protein ACK3Q6_003738 [Burkholderia cepacia]|uniref:Uncharacterized protein n=1 Tax=Burkholderia contaminans TaxID=488447 RepID=A0A250LL42_9BURK|nr:MULTISPECIES: hypothetical protein [Burkholderia]HDV6369979.1 hypothetical protein [Burkholderia cepacia]MBR8290443.1 hypothetical protein [Burkholderia cenocepacia]MBX3826598.1 hypothetical protein [Burkholderia contaminans]MBX3845613.1 hypothetical protein [Burkholderia contaminans]MBX3863916.1 hypothetical protein [Burkholderia contaminans]
MGYHHFSIGHEIAAASVRGVVYAVERHLLRGMSLSEILVIGILIVAVVKLLGRRRPAY